MIKSIYLILILSLLTGNYEIYAQSLTEAELESKDRLVVESIEACGSNILQDDRWRKQLKLRDVWDYTTLKMINHFKPKDHGALGQLSFDNR